MRTVSLSVSLSLAAGGEGAESLPHPKSFDTDLSALQQQVSRIVLQLLTDLGSSSAVKRHFLSGVTALCLFMMRQVNTTCYGVSSTQPCAGSR